MVHNGGYPVTVEGLRFTKMHGAGNDFIMVNGRDVPLALRPGISAALCRRRTSIGADGLILVTRIGDASIDVDFYNPDGSQAEMCGNGSRCAARFAVEMLGVSPEHVMETVAGTLPARYEGPEQIAVVMPTPAQPRLSHATVDGTELHHVIVGVPHTVVVADSIDDWPDERLRAFGARLRFDKDLYPEGTNLNVVARVGTDQWRVRTYERGVEDITLACGTGNTAVSYVLVALALGEHPFRSIVDGGNLAIERGGERFWLVGPARAVMTGQVSAEALLGD
jgi:diaminopimelate epimerase